MTKPYTGREGEVEREHDAREHDKRGDLFQGNREQSQRLYPLYQGKRHAGNCHDGEPGEEQNAYCNIEKLFQKKGPARRFLEDRAEGNPHPGHEPGDGPEEHE